MERNNEALDKKNTPETESESSKDLKLNKEIETDAAGNKIIVDRARNLSEEMEIESTTIDRDNPNINRGVETETEAMKTVENKDLNSDITSKRYSNSDPKNQEDRGNTKLDE